jgi:hypothetical protein
LAAAPSKRGSLSEPRAGPASPGNAKADALTAKPSTETRGRIEALLARPRLVRDPKVQRGLRAIEVLAHVGTAEAGEVLRSVADGDHESRLTRQAKSALDQVTRRLAANPR